MAMSNRVLEYLISLEDTLSGQVEKVASHLRNLESASEKAAATMERSNKRAAGSLGQIGDISDKVTIRILSLLEAIGGLQQLASSVVEGADAWKRYDAQLRLATDNAEQHARAQSELFRISQENRTELESSVDLYQRLALSRKALNLEQQDLLDITELVTQSLKVSGATTSEAASTVQQFGQALGSGVLRGEEFNSLMENGTRLAQALADGLDVPITRLRQMAEAGELTAKRVTQALLSQKEVIADEYSKMPLTVEDSVVRLGNAWQKYIGETDEALGASTALADALATLADHFDEVAGYAAEAGKLLVAAFAVKGAQAIKAYVVEVIAASAKTGRLATQAGLAEVAMTKLGAATKAVAWAAVAYEITTIATALAELAIQEKTNADLQDELAEQHQQVADTLAEVSRQTGINITSMEQFNRLVKDQAIVQNEANGQWENARNTLQLLAYQADETGKALNDATTPQKTDWLQSWNFGKLQEELASITSDTLPGFISKVGEMGQQSEISAPMLEALTAQIVDMAKRFQEAADAADSNNASAQETIDALHDQIGAYRESSGASNEAAEASAHVGDASKEASEDVDGLSEASSGAADIMAKMSAAMDTAVAALGRYSQRAKEAVESLRLSGGSFDDFIAGVQRLNENAAQFVRDDAMGGMVSEVNKLEAGVAEAQGEIEKLNDKIREAPLAWRPWYEGLREIAKFEKALAEAAVAEQRLDIATEQLGQNMEDLQRRFESGELSLGQYTQQLGFLQSRYQHLGDERLEGLRDALADAKRRTEELRESAEDAVRSLQDELDALDDNQAAIEQRRYEKRREDLEKQLEAARAAGDAQAVQALQKALNLAEQVHRRKMEQLREELEGQRAITHEREREQSREDANRTLPATPRPPSQRDDQEPTPYGAPRTLPASPYPTAGAAGAAGFQAPNLMTLRLEGPTGRPATLQGTDEEIQALLDILKSAGATAQ